MTMQFRDTQFDKSENAAVDFHAKLKTAIPETNARHIDLSATDAATVNTSTTAAKGVRGVFARLLAGVKIGPKLKSTGKQWFGRKLRRARAAMRLRQQRRAKTRARLAAVLARASAFDARALEPRIVFDAAGVATVDAANEVAADTSDDITEDSRARAASDDEANDLSAAVSAIAINGVSASSQNAVVFVDAGVENAEEIIATLDASVEVVLIDRESDGVTQIANALSGRSEIDAVHIVSHGNSGELHLGNATLTETSMRGEHADALAIIGAALGDNADVLIYGCDFGADATGASAIETFRELTGADIAASDDDTGHANLGGDWDLEVQAGAIEAQAIEATEWRGRLDLEVTVAANDTAVRNLFINDFIGEGISVNVNGNGQIDNNEYSQIGDHSQFGSFVNDSDGAGPSVLPVSDGVVFVTGDADTADNGNTQDNTGFGGGISTSPFPLNPTFAWGGGDTDLSTLSGGPTYDAAGFDFKFQGATDRIAFVFSFASDEYPEFVGTPFNDAFGFFIQGGTDYVTTTNLAVVPGTSDGIAVNTINSGQPGSANGVPGNFNAGNSSLYIDNSATDGGSVPVGGAVDSRLEYDGLTVLLSVDADITRDTEYDMKIGIADAGDPQWDSAVFFRTDGFIALTSATDNVYTTAENTAVSGNLITDDTGDDVDITPLGDQAGIQVTALTDSNGTVIPVSAGTAVLPSGATITFQANGQYTFDPTTSSTYQALNDGDQATETFTYSIVDAGGVTDTAQVTITVNGLSDTDGDGVADVDDVDDDNDGILDTEEGYVAAGQVGAFPFYTYAPAVAGLTAGPYDVSWVVDGTAVTGTVQNSAEFTQFLNDNDPDGLLWTDNPALSAVSRELIPAPDFPQATADLLATFGTITVTHTATSIEADLNTNVSGNLTTERSRDTDQDGIADHLDIDSDNDGITDNIEAQATDAYIAPSGVGAGITDLNKDGLDDNYDLRAVTNATAAATAANARIAPVNSDGQDNPDYLDTDSDGDGVFDIVEAGLGAADTDGDGRADQTENPGPDTIPGTGDEFLEFADADGDGLLDAVDAQNSTTANDGFVV
ncbi:MAG: DUF4347 domain-containing protein, partial [Pseudomonadota bacterium]